MVIRTSTGKLVPGVTATPSTHLRGLSPADEIARIKTVDDLWVDVGASSAAEVEQLGIRMLDPVSLRERSQPLANGRFGGVGAQLRAGAQTLIEMITGHASEPRVKGTVTLAWVTQSQFGGRGFARLARSMIPDDAYLLFPQPQTARRPAEWDKVLVESNAVPALFAQTPVEVVSITDIAELAQKLGANVGLPSAAARPAAPTRVAVSEGGFPPSGSFRMPREPFEMLKTLIEIPAVSGHELLMRRAIAILTGPGAKADIDDKGNVLVTFGSGGRELVFLAHMDEVGFEITAIREDGTASVRTRGGMYLSLYEARPVFVETMDDTGWRVPAVLTPRRDYAAAKRSQPEIEELSLYFGTASAAETRALGVKTGQAATIRKRFQPLSGERATGRAMDDRAGSTALLLAMQLIDPKTVKNRVTFAWTVEEETGLSGAAFIASRMKPDHAFAVDTFVSTDTPLDVQHLAHAELGKGAVLRGMDSRTAAPPSTIDRIVAIARQAGIPLQIGITQGGTDASVFSAGGAIDVGLSWPGRYSHSPVEVIDRRDLESLAKLIAAIASQF